MSSPDEIGREIRALENAAWQEQKDRHKDWWSLPTHELLTVLTYEAGYDDGYEQAVADIASAWAVGTAENEPGERWSA